MAKTLQADACAVAQCGTAGKVQAIGWCGESVPIGVSLDSQTVPMGGLKAP